MAAYRNRNHFLDEMLKRYDRLAIYGAPKCGKTTLVRRITDRPVIACDFYMHLPWSEASQRIRDVANAVPGPVAVEGVRVPHAVRKGMRVDAVLVLDQPLVEQTPGQITMGKASDTVLSEVRTLWPDLPVITAPKIHLEQEREIED